MKQFCVFCLNTLFTLCFGSIHVSSLPYVSCICFVMNCWVHVDVNISFFFFSTLIDG